MIVDRRESKLATKATSASSRRRSFAARASRDHLRTQSPVAVASGAAHFTPSVAPLGVPRIGLLRVDGEAVACNYYFLFRDCMYFHELAFDPLLARWSPGQIATLDSIEAAAAEGARRVEFLGGAERYKLDWRPNCGLRLGPHFYSTEAEVERMMARVIELAGR